MIKSFLNSLEDPKRRLLAPTIWSLELTGLILPNNCLGTCKRLFVHVNVLYFVITQFTEAYFLKDDLGLVLTNLKIAMLSLTASVKISSFIFFQKKWHMIFDYITKSDQFERDNQDEISEAIINNYTKYCRKVTYFYWFLMFNTHLAHVIAAVCQPLFLFATSKVYRENYRNGTVSFPHIFSSWTPFDKDQSPGCWFLVVWHYLLCVNGASVVGAYDASIVVCMVFFGGKLDLLRERCKNMFGKNEIGLCNEEFEDNLRNLQRIHVELIKHSKITTQGWCRARTACQYGRIGAKALFCFYNESSAQNYEHSRLLNSLLSPVMFIYVILCTLMLCSSLFQITSETEFFQKFLLAEYLIFGIAQLFLVCLPSSNCYIKSQDVAMGPYESKWWNSTATIRQKKDILLLCGQLRQATKFTAGPFTDLNLPTFVAILKGSYSYYALLRD